MHDCAHHLSVLATPATGAVCSVYRGSAADLKKDSVRFLCMVLLTSKSFSHGSKTIGVVSVHVPVGPACVLVCAVACRARRVVGTKRSSLRS